MAAIPTIRIACDISNFDAPRDVRTGRTPIFWKGNDLQFQLAVFDHDGLQSLANINRIILDIKPMGPEETAPDVSILPIMRGEAPADTFDESITDETWKNGTQQQAVNIFSADESSVSAQDAWLVIWAETTDDPEKILTLCAGRISIRESSGGIDLTPPMPPDRFYDREQCDTLFARRNHNLSDLTSMAECRDNLQLGAAALYGVLNEDDMASDSSTSLPTQRSIKSYVDNSIAAIPTASGSSYYFANATFRLNSNGTAPAFKSNAMVPLTDGWVGYQSSADATNTTTATIASVDSSLGINCMRVMRAANNTSTANIFIYRPFSPSETYPLRGKEVTFSVDLMAGIGFPTTAAQGVTVSVTGTTQTSGAIKIKNSGEFLLGNQLIQNFSTVGGFSTSSYARYSFTFTIPANVTQICLRFVHTPIGSGSAVPSGYEYRIYRPAIGIGSSEQPFSLWPLAEDQTRMADRYQRILAAWYGAVTQGDTIKQPIIFPSPFGGVPNCTYVEDGSLPVGFAGASTANITAISATDAVLSRSATATSSAASFRTFYTFMVPLW
jgi:hypothetical protein